MDCEHKFNTIYTIDMIDNNHHVVRWCHLCGGVRVDIDMLDFDATMEGAVTKLTYPDVWLDKVLGDEDG